uniref:biotinidase-like n=1 Tax=Myxine glutinosa TaxID=7769 RepID=UPI00358FE024
MALKRSFIHIIVCIPQQVLYRFSCMAKENDLFVVGNMGSVETCTSQSHPNCPSDGRFQFNTNVAFNSDGLLVSRYRKYHLYFEDHYYNTPNQVDYAIFNTPFAGDFAMFICYDLLFGSPAMELVKRHGVKNIAFSTAWFDHLPLLSSIQAQRAYSAGFGITLLASNLNIPERKAFGSGIYFPGGSKYRHGNGSHLLVAHVPLWSEDALSQEIPLTEKKVNQWEAYNDRGEFKTVEEPPFNQIMMYDEYTFVSLSNDTGERSICHGEVCCSVKYQRTTNSSELYALAAYDGKHTIRQVFYHQICTLLRCAGPRRESCGKPTSHAVTTFNFELWGNFGTEYVFPAILTDGMHLQEPDSFGRLKDGRYSIAARMAEGLVTATLYSRVYDRD